MVTVPLRSPDVSKSQVILGKNLRNLVPGKRPYNILQMVDAKHIGDLSHKKAMYHREQVEAKHLIATMRRRGATCVKKIISRLSSNIFVNPYMKAMAQIEQMPAVVQLFINSQQSTGIHPNAEVLFVAFGTHAQQGVRKHFVGVRHQ